jgi:type I restriction enzyme S subunit
MNKKNEQDLLVPEFRFPEFSGPWVERRGGELFGNSRTKGEAGLSIYSVTQKHGLVPRNSLARRVEDDAADESNLRTQPGDLVYNMMRMWQGAVGLTDVECMVSPAYVVLSAKSNTDSKFFLYNLERARSLYDLWAYSYGLTNDRLRLYFKDFAKINFRVPGSREEQTKIADFLLVIDRKREELIKKQKLLDKYKHGLIQKILSQDIRFKQNDGSAFPRWRDMELGEILAYEQPTKYLVSDSTYCSKHKTPVLTAGKTFVLGYTNEDFGVFSHRLPVIIFDDFTTSIQYVDFPFKAKSSAMKILKPISDHDQVKVIYEFMKLLKFSSEEHKRYWISEYQFLCMPLPCYEEQEKIVRFLDDFERKLKSVIQQIERLETYKKGLLQKMFV